MSRFSSALGICTALAMAGAASAQAQVSWDAGSGTNLNWDTATNWSGDLVPTVGTDVLFPTPIPNPGNLLGAETITLGTASTAKSLTFRDSYTLSGGTLNLAGGTITVSPSVFGATINSVISANNLTLAGSNGLTGPAAETGGGTLILGGANTLTGVTSVNSGTLQLTNLAALGISSASIAPGATLSLLTAGGTFTNSVKLNGGTFRNEGANQVTMGTGTTINVAASSTVDVPINGPTGKLFLTAGQLTGAGGVTLTKTGAGTFQLSGANSSFAGAIAIEGGQVEAQNANALGDNSSTNTITIRTGGELVSSGVTIPHKITLDGGSISANANANANFTGDITIASDSTAQLRYFQTLGTGNGFKISGKLLGSGSLTVSAPNAQTLTLSGNNVGSGFTGSIRPTNNATVAFSSPASAVPVMLAGGTLRALNTLGTVANAGVNGFNARYYNLTSTPSATTAVNYGATPTVAIRIDPTIDIPNAGAFTPNPAVPGLNGANIAAFWSGLLNINAADTYTFTTNSDDGSQVYIDGQLVVSHDGGHGVSAKTGTISLTPGAHEIVYRYYQGTGSAAAKLEYSGADTAGATTVVGATAGTVTSGKLAAIDGGTFPITAESFTSSAIDVGVDTIFGGPITLQNGSTLRITSPTLSTATFNGTVTLQGDASMGGETAAAVFNGKISAGGTAASLTVVGPYLTTFTAKNDYTGDTNVPGAQLQLNSTAGDAIAGNLNISNGGLVRLLRAEQIADNRTVVVDSSTLDLGANAEKIANLTLQNNGSVIGSGILTLPNNAAPQLSSGTLGVVLAGSNLAINKSGPETLTFTGANTYTGVTTVTDGQLVVSGVGTLGATGTGNGTVVSGSGELVLRNGANLTGELLTLNRTGTSLRSSNGNNTAGPITLTTDTGIAVESDTLTLGSVTGSNKSLTINAAGNLALGGVINLGGGTFTKTGKGTLIHNVDAGTQVSLNIANISGKQVFNGTQTFAANTIASGNTWQFNSPASIPGSGGSITVASGGTVIAGYPIDQSFVARLNPASAGLVVLGANSSNNLNLATVGLNTGLGAADLFTTYSGALTPNGNTFRLGGGGGKLTVSSALTGAGNSLVVNGSVELTGQNTFGGTGSSVTVGNGSELIVLNNSALGDAANSINLDGGTLRFFNQTNSSVGFGGGHGRVSRTINIGAAGGTINVPNQNIIAFNNANTFTGTGTLTKTGLGEFQLVGANDFAGKIVVGPNGGIFDVRAGGRLSNVTEITVNQGSTLRLNNQDAVALFGVTNDGNRLNDAAVINLRGGTFNFTAQNATGVTNTTETVGTINVQEGQAFLNVERRGGDGSTLTIDTLNRSFGTTVRVGGTNINTLGNTGDNARIKINNWKVNGTAITAPNGFIGGWATLNGTDYLAYNGTSLLTATYTALANAATPGTGGFTAANVGNITGADITVGTAGTPGSFEVGSIRFADASTRQLLFANNDDRLYLTGGGILSQDVNNARTIGTTTARGQITAGPATGNTAPRELFLYQNQNTMTINSNIVDNNGQAVTLVKALDGAVIIDAPGNTFSGGTNVLRGTLQVNNTGGLGTGPVLVKGGRLQMQQPGVSSSTVPMEAKDGGEIFLNNSSASFTSDGDRFVIRAGSSIMGNNNGFADVGLNSLSRVNTITAGGQVILEPGAIVGHNTFNNSNVNGTGVNTIKDLGTNADLFYGLTGNANAGVNQSVTIGAGTPWMGMSTDSRAGRAWQQGTIFVNSDFALQGAVTNGGIQTLTLGGNNVNGTYSIVNNSANPVRGFIMGNVALDENSAVSMPSNLTFVVTPQATLQPNRVNSFGSGSNVASVIVQAAGTLDPGNFGTASATPTPGPVNANVTIEAGGRLLLNDSSGFGTGGTITVQPEGIVEMASQSNALAGIGTGQFAFQPGSIVRLNQDNMVNLNTAIGGGGVILQVYGGNRTVTSQANPYVTAGAGSPNIRPENVTIGAGGGITNDSSSNRQLNSGRGTIILAGDAFISGTTGSGTFSIQEDLRLAPGVTLTIGSGDINGNPKQGDVRFVGRASNIGDATNTIRVISGQRLLLGTDNTIPDSTTVDLQAGSSLLLDSGNLNEVIGRLTGTGTILGNGTVGNMAVVAGWNVPDFTFGGVFSSTGSQQPNLTKWGTNKMTLTGANTSTGDLRIEQGELTLSGTGSTAFGIVRPAKGATLTLDNSVVAQDNRLGSKNISGQGGTVNLIGNATTAVNETIGQLNNSGGPVGGVTKIKVTPGQAMTTLTINAMERFDNTGSRNATFVFQSPTLANLPGTYTSDNTYTPNAANLTNGLIKVTNPRFVANNGFDQQNQPAIAGVIGSPLAPTRPDLLADLNGDGIGDRFVTQEASGAGLRALANSEYVPLPWAHATTAANVKASGTASVFGDSRVQTLTLASGSTVNINGNLPYSQQPSRLVLVGGGLLVEGGTGTTTINGNGTHLQSNGGVSMYLHANGDLNLNAIAYSDTGIIKTGAGNLTFGDGAASVFRNQLVIEDGKVTLGANNHFFQTRQQNTLNGIKLALNGGTLELNGNSQVLDQLISANALPYGGAAGGILTSSTPATVAVQGRSGSSTFSGQINGAISLDKVGANTLLLTNNNNLTGTTSVRGGTLQLREEGTLSNTSGLTLNYGTLMLDNSSLSNINNRVKAGITVDMRGGTIDLRGAAGKLSEQSFGTVNALAGQVTLRADAGGAGAAVINVDNLKRTDASRAFVNFTTGFGSSGAGGNDTTAARFMVAKINDATPALTNGMIGGWAIVNGDHFASYYAPTGMGALSNTTDGYFPYSSSDLSTAADAATTVNDGTARTLAASKSVYALRYGSGSGAITLTMNAGVKLTLASGGFITNVGQGTTIGNVASQGEITSGTDSLYAWINQNTTTFNAVVSGGIDLVKGGGGTLTLAGNNTYTGKTYVDGGTLTLNTANANGTTVVSVPGDLEIHNATVSEGVAQTIKATSNVTLYGDAVLNLRDAAGITETLNSLTFINTGGGSDNRSIVSRANAQATSALNLSGANAITVTNQNAFTDPALSVNLGTVNFTAANGTQTINVTSDGSNPIGFLFNSIIGTVPANPSGGEGGLVKTGNGVLVLNAANTFGTAPTAFTPTFDIREGIVHASNNGALGSSRNQLTTVQSGAGLIGRGSLTGITGSVRFKPGSFLSATEGSPVFGVATTDPAAQQIFEVTDSGAVANDLTIYATEYWVQQTNAANITVNGKLTGSGRINIVGPTLAQTTGAGGVVRFANPIETGNGSNDFSGIITVGTNTVLESNRQLVSGATSTTGSTLGTASIELNGGRLRIREDLSNANTTVANTSISYNHKVTLLADSFIDANRTTSNTGIIGNTVALTSLDVPSGTRTLTVDSGNSYRIKFGELTGAGTLIKGGTSVLEIDSATNFTGSLGIAGPQGVGVGPAYNLILNGETTLQNFQVDGAYTVGFQPLTVKGVLGVGSNAGSVGNGTNGVTTGSTTGGLAITSGAPFTFGPNSTLRNNGVVGAWQGSVTLNPSKIEGAGLYQTVGQSLELAAPIVDGVSASKLKIAGDSMVTVSSTGHNFSGGVEVQSGYLSVTPNATGTTAFGSGGIKVMGTAGSSLGENSQPVATNSATLEFNSGTGKVTHAGDISNHGLVQVTSGTTEITGVISGAATYVPGLLEGRITGGQAGDLSDNRAANPGNFGIKLEPRMAQTNLVTQNPLTGWGDNEMWVYTGEFFDADGIFSFIENIDDNVLISVDGVTRLLNNVNGSNQPANTGSWNTITSTAMAVGQQGGTVVTGANTGIAETNFGMGPNKDGWHTIEIRVRNGSGGAGSVFAANYGIGLNTSGTTVLDGGAFSRPIDPGDGSLFRTKIDGDSKIAVESGATLAVGGFTSISELNLNGGTSAPSTLRVTAGGNSTATNVAVQIATMEVQGTGAVSVDGLSVAAGGSLTKTGSGKLQVKTGVLDFDAVLKVNEGKFAVNGTLAGGAVNVGGTSSAVHGSLGGAGTINAPVTLSNFGSLVPGNETGVLEFLSKLTFGSGTALEFQLGNSPATSDLVKLTGANSSLIFAGNWTLKLDQGANFDPTGMTFVLFDGDLSAPIANFGTPSIVSMTPFWNTDNAVISYNAVTNDIILRGVVPEPATGVMALTGLGSLLGLRRFRRRA